MAGPYADVATCLQEALTKNANGEFRGLLTKVMEQPGHLLARREQKLWPAFVVTTCEALGGERAVGLWPAAAVEFAVGAIDVADDLGDGQWNEGWSRPARAPNASVALGALAQYSIARSSEYLGADGAHRVGELLAQGCMESCSGQDLDFLLEQQSSITEAAAHQTTWQKSGTLVAMAFKIGAACATNNAEVIATVGEFGTRVGVISQLINDMNGLDPNKRHRGTDIALRKKTLPVAYALRCAADEGISTLLDWYSGIGVGEPGEEDRIAQLISDLGAFHYTVSVAEIHRKEALAALRSLEELTGRGPMRSLSALVGRIRLRPREMGA